MQKLAHPTRALQWVRASSLAIPESGGLDRLVCSGSGAAWQVDVELNLPTTVGPGQMNRV